MKHHEIFHFGLNILFFCRFSYKLTVKNISACTYVEHQSKRDNDASLYSRELVVSVVDQFAHFLLASLDDVDFLWSRQRELLSIVHYDIKHANLVEHEM